MDSIQDLHKFWNQPEPNGNIPLEFVFETHRSKAFYEIIKNKNKDIKILEVGCNVARNLNYLYEMGFTNLTGIEISEYAVSLMKKVYPNLQATIFNGSAETVLTAFKDNEFDLVFTIAVLEHIHPDSNVFSELKRVAKERIFVEPIGLNHISHRQYPNDLNKLFEVNNTVYQFDDYQAYIC